MNKFQFMGRLTRDPETRVLPNSSTNVTTFSLAVNRRFADANGERKTDFFNLTAFGRLADFCGKYYNGMIKMDKKDMLQTLLLKTHILQILEEIKTCLLEKYLHLVWMVNSLQ